MWGSGNEAPIAFHGDGPLPPTYRSSHNRHKPSTFSFSAARFCDSLLPKLFTNLGLYFVDLKALLQDLQSVMRSESSVVKQVSPMHRSSPTKRPSSLRLMLLRRHEPSCHPATRPWPSFAHASQTLEEMGRKHKFNARTSMNGFSAFLEASIADAREEPLVKAMARLHMHRGDEPMAADLNEIANGEQAGATCAAHTSPGNRAERGILVVGTRRAPGVLPSVSSAARLVVESPLWRQGHGFLRATSHTGIECRPQARGVEPLQRPEKQGTEATGPQGKGGCRVRHRRPGGEWLTRLSGSPSMSRG